MTQLITSNQLTLTNIYDGTITHTAYAYSADGTDRFTTVYPNLNLFTGTSDKPFTKTGTNWNLAVIGVYKTPKVGQEYTVSVEVPEADHNLIIEVFRWNNAGARVGSVVANKVVKSGEKAYVTFTWTDPGSSGATQFAADLAWTNGTDTGTYSYCKAKLEIGNTATPYMRSSSEVTDNDYPRYRGEYSDFSSTASTDPLKYSWSLIRGNTSYSHTAYAYSSDGTDRFTTVYPNLNLLVNSSAKTKDGFFKNFDKVENDYGEVTLKGTNTWVARNLSDGFTMQPRDYKPNDIYTMSMDVMFTSWNLPAGTTLTEFWMVQRYTRNNDGTINVWKLICSVDLPKDPSQMLNQWIRITQTSTIPPYADPSVNTETKFEAKFTGPSEGSFTFRVRKPKQEQGSVATTWMPSSSEVTTSDYPSYIGTYSDTNVDGSTDPSKYTWAVFKGSDGIAGANAPIITNVQDQIYLSTSNTVQSGGSWGILIPTWSSGKYYWSRVATTFDNGTTTYSTPVLDEALNQAATNQIKVTQLTQDLDGFKTTVSNTYLSKSDASGTYADKNSVVSQITQLATDINLRVSKGDVTSQINLESGRTLIDTKQLLLNADTVKFTGSAFIPDVMIQSITADKITAGTIDAANVNVINLNAANITTGTLSGANLSMNLNTGEVLFQKGVIKKTDGSFVIDITNGEISSDDSKGGFSLKSGALKLRRKADNAEYGSINYGFDNDGEWNLGLTIVGNEGYMFKTQNYTSSFSGSRAIIGSGIKSNTTSNLTKINLEAQNGISLFGGKTFDSSSFIMPYFSVGDISSDIYGNAQNIKFYSTAKDALTAFIISPGQIEISAKQTFVWGNFSAVGSKNAIHVTRDGVRATPAYETAESYLGDIGRNYTRENYEVWVEIDLLFSDTVNTDIAYEVFLQAYDNARFWVEDFKPDKFLIKSDKPMARFAWEIKAKRRGYENDRLVIQEGVDNDLLDRAHDEGAL